MNTIILSQERELWNTLSKSEYDRVLRYCQDAFGQPLVETRLALQVTDFHRGDFDTRIRITNGLPVLIQKGGDWNDAVRGESVLALPKDAPFIASLYQMLGRMLDSDNIQRTAIKLENTLFKNDEVEIKLTRHLGPEELYSFEVEQLDEKASLEKAVQALGVEPDLSYKDEAYWKKFNARVNVDAGKLSQGELTGLIEEFLVK